MQDGIQWEWLQYLCWWVLMTWPRKTLTFIVFYYYCVMCVLRASGPSSQNLSWFPWCEATRSLTTPLWLLTGTKSCYLHGGRVVTLGGRVVIFREEELLPLGEGVVTFRGEELLPSGGRVVTLGGKSSFNSNIFFFPYQPLGLELQLPYFYTLWCQLL